MDIKGAAQRSALNAFRKLPPSAQQKIKDRRVRLMGIEQLKETTRCWPCASLTSSRCSMNHSPAPPGAPQVPDRRFPDGVRSRLCTSEQWSEPWFAQWCERPGEAPTRHRKTWEFVYIAHVVDALGLLEAGRRGVGFGVGRDPLASGLAARGIEVVATDLDPGDREAAGWVHSGQHAAGILNGLRRDALIDPDEFARLVSFRPADMRDIPADLTGFDFCWSACALEHLGSLDAGLEFIENSLRTLRPGGVAIHTTEFNLTSNDATIQSGPCVVYRERDIVALIERLERAGHEVAALDLSRGNGVLDHYVDLPPYKVEPVLRFQFGNYALTSVAIVVRRAGLPVA